MSGQHKNKRKSMQKWNNRFAMIMVTVVVASMALVVNLKVNSLKTKEDVYMNKEELLKKQVSEEEERAETLEQYRIYVQTKQYIEKVAKEKLGLINPDEILLKPNN